MLSFKLNNYSNDIKPLTIQSNPFEQHFFCIYSLCMKHQLHITW